VRERLLEPLRKQYNASEIDVSAGDPYQVTVLISGAVKSQGYFRGWTSEHVSDIIASAGGFVPGASSRRIQFVGGPKTLTVDLDRSTYLGVDSLNPSLYAGRRIVVPMMTKNRVQVVGEVVRPREIELLPGDNVASLIEMAGGVRDGVTNPVVELIDRGRKIVTGVDTVVSGDIIVVRSQESSEDSTVLVFGEVAAPGRYALAAGMTLGQIIQKAGGTTREANAGRTTIFRMAEPDEFGGTEQTRYAIGDLFSATGISTAVLKANDSVLVPRMLGYVKVAGLVSKPGLLPYVEGKDAMYYVDAAGGFLPKSNRTLLRLTDRVTRNSVQASPAVTVRDGDEITVLQIEELR
jgi:protein involved in polysaccharide export with SLBB domain